MINRPYIVLHFFYKTLKCKHKDKFQDKQ